MARPNVVGPFRYAFGLTAIMLICVSPIVWLFVDALRSGNQGYMGSVGIFAVPALFGVVVFCWGLYRDRRRLFRSEFTDAPSQANADAHR